MKPLTALWSPSLLALACCAPALADPTCATVEVDNVRPQQGQLMVAAYGSDADFGKRPLASLRLPAAEAKMRFELCGLSGASVALTLFQDLDGDGKLTRNLLGVPTEPWGASGTPGAFGPSWDSVRVALDDRAIAVRMSP